MDSEAAAEPPGSRPRSRFVILVRRGLGLAFCALLLASVLLVTAGVRDRLGRADVAVVLGSKVERNGQPSARLRARLDKTASLYAQGYYGRIIVSGGVGKEGFDESVVMRDYLVSKGVPSWVIIMDPKGVTTAATAINTRKIADEHDFQSVFVVTQYFHIPRSRLALKRCGFQQVYSAHPRFFEMRDLYSIPREMVGYVSYSTREFRNDQESPEVSPAPK